MNIGRDSWNSLADLEFSYRLATDPTRRPAT
jgi:hypothetical protein